MRELHHGDISGSSTGTAALQKTYSNVPRVKASTGSLVEHRLWLTAEPSSNLDVICAA